VSRRRLKIIDRGNTVVLHGWRAGDLAKEADVRAVFNGIAGGWVADASRLPDLVAYLQYRNVTVSIVPEGGDAA
jgi:hypothetical protein